MSPHEQLVALIEENQRLLIENNLLLKKMHQRAVRHFWFNIAWIVLFFILPLIALYRLAVPFYSSLDSSPSTLDGQLQQINELRGLLEQ